MQIRVAPIQGSLSFYVLDVPALGPMKVRIENILQRCRVLSYESRPGSFEALTLKNPVGLGRLRRVVSEVKALWRSSC